MYLDNRWTVFWVISGIVLIVYSRIKSSHLSPKEFSISFGGIFVGFQYLFIEFYKIVMQESFLESVQTRNQPLIFFSLVFLNLAFVIAFRYFFKNSIGQVSFKSDFYFVWLGLSIPEIFTKFVPILENTSLIIFLGYIVLFLLYNFGLTYFLDKSLPNSKLGMFAAVLKLIFDIWFVGIIGHEIKFEDVLGFFVLLVILILILVFLHMKKENDSKKVEAT